MHARARTVRTYNACMYMYVRTNDIYKHCTSAQKQMRRIKVLNNINNNSKSFKN